MADFKITRPESDLLRVQFPDGWDAKAESGEMFRTILTELDDSDTPLTLFIVAGDERPIYDELSVARAILTHDRLKQIIVVAEDSEAAINHMGATRGERGLPPIGMYAFDNEEDALKKV